MVSAPNPGKWVRKKFESAVYSVVSKLNYPTAQYTQDPRVKKPEPPYQREVHPRWIYKLRQNSTLVNNAIEEKVSQTFRRGFTEWEEEYKAKCTNCKEEFQTLEPFKDQLGEAGEDLEDEDIDLESPRVCPNCKEIVEINVPDAEDKEKGEDFFRQVNEKTDVRSHLEPTEQNSVGQSFLQLCKEVAWDIQSFDDGWMLFDREYTLDPESGVILDYELKNIHRAPPELMRYSIDEDTGGFGDQYWVCVDCRNSVDEYSPEREPVDCKHCGNHTYEVYAVALQEPRGDPAYFYIRGEFAHASEYEPGKYYGYSPILTLWEEARTIEQMDEWYKSAYQERRAPRGAMLIRSSNAESVRAFNQGQMEKLRNDQHYIPTFIDDTEGRGQALEWVSLLEDPVEMQHVDMRNWFLERISAKYGVTAVFQQGSPNNSGLSQSLEIIVSNRSADRLRHIFNTTFIPAFLGQLQIDGWTRELRPVEAEEEAQKADIQGQYMKNAKTAADVGFDIEWTEDDELKVHPGDPTEDVDAATEGEMMPDSQLPQQEGPQPVQAGAQGKNPRGSGGYGDAPRKPEGNKADAPVTTDSPGYRNVRYGSEEDEEIDVLGNLREMFEEEAEKTDKSADELTWSDVDIQETMRVWIKTPDGAPQDVEVHYEPESDVDADFYYEESLTTIDVDVAQKINKDAEAVDFFWQHTPASLNKLQLPRRRTICKGAPENCDRQYVDNPGDAPEDAQVYEGVRKPDAYFYCSNYTDIGDYESGQDGGRMLDEDEFEERFGAPIILYEKEKVELVDSINDVGEGETIVQVKQGVDRADTTYLQEKFEDYVSVESSGEMSSLVRRENMEEMLVGKIATPTVKLPFEQYENYDPPEDKTNIFDEEKLEDINSIKSVEDVSGGVNAKMTWIAEFENGSSSVYKNDPGNSHRDVLNSEAMAWEISDMLGELDTIPTTGLSNLGKGFGSSIEWVENSETFGDKYPRRKEFSIPARREEGLDVLVDNAERCGEIFAFDFILGNGDRHMDNIVVDDNDVIHGIDNGGYVHPDKHYFRGNGIIHSFKKYINKAYYVGEIDETEAEDMVEEFFEELEKGCSSVMENLSNNREELLEKAAVLYGPESEMYERFAQLTSEEDVRGEWSEMVDRIKEDINENI